ncbi:MAG: BlaI/MecI/CopY family transcriptional regulator [Pseudoflavonifractor sp.]|nr:BlaI/MecI/CopY family transcriptional regulator [Alloprevotella sp.]MCM1116858.1 BlaI/MecI/CopY family transcriptional regulator [Pseudoflavonifractor sp.]
MSNSHLTPREEQIMQIFWTEGEMPVRRLVELFPEPRPHINTVSTIVRILEDKGYVGHRAEGKGYVYFAKVSPAQVGSSSIRSAISRYFSGSFAGMVSALVKDEEVSVDELRHLLDEIEKANASKHQ